MNRHFFFKKKTMLRFVGCYVARRVSSKLLKPVPFSSFKPLSIKVVNALC